MRLVTYLKDIPTNIPDGSERDRLNRPRLYRSDDPVKTFNEYWAKEQEEGMWYAEVEGPWYNDSNPVCRGKTEKEAVDKVLLHVKEIYDEAKRFLIQNGVEL